MYATIQVDLDGIWTIYQHHQVEQSHYPDSVFEQSIPRFLELFRSFNIQSTFFIVGSDLEIPETAAGIKQIADAGHELANHSYTHPRNFAQLSIQEKKDQIEKTGKLIQQITNHSVSGFRAPSYAIDQDTFRILENLGYGYDSSIFPTYWSGLIRRFESGFTVCNSKPAANYGKIQYSKAPLQIYHPDPEVLWKKGTAKLWEVPISVFPLIRTPLHSSFSTRIGWWYFLSGINWLYRIKVPLVFLFHGVDLVDQFVDARIPKIKWIQSPVEKRIERFRRMLGWIASKYNIIPTRELVAIISRNGNIKSYPAD